MIRSQILKAAKPSAYRDMITTAVVLPSIKARNRENRRDYDHASGQIIKNLEPIIDLFLKSISIEGTTVLRFADGREKFFLGYKECYSFFLKQWNEQCDRYDASRKKGFNLCLVNTEIFEEVFKPLEQEKYSVHSDFNIFKFLRR